jgi:hypothetical protein
MPVKGPDGSSDPEKMVAKNPNTTSRNKQKNPETPFEKFCQLVGQGKGSIVIHWVTVQLF